MLIGRRWRAAALAVFTVVVACGSGQHVTVGQQPATIESVPGSSQVRIHLSALAAKRLGIATSTIKLLPAVSAAASTTLTTQSPGVPTTSGVPSPSGVAPAGTPDTEPHPVAPPPTTAPTTTPPTTTPPTTTPPTTSVPPVARLVIPVAAVLYEPTGDAYTYTSPAPLTYVRQPLSIAYVVGDNAVLAAGPSAGTVVVVVGGAELTGIETGVGNA